MFVGLRLVMQVAKLELTYRDVDGISIYNANHFMRLLISSKEIKV